MSKASQFYIETTNKDSFVVTEVIENAITSVTTTSEEVTHTVFHILPRLKMVMCLFKYDKHLRNLFILFDAEDEENNPTPCIRFSLQHNSEEGGEIDCLRSIADYIYSIRGEHKWIGSIWFCEDDGDGKDFVLYGES